MPIILLPIFAIGKYGNDPEWFFVSQFPITYFPLWCCIIINTVLYLKAALYLKRVMGTISVSDAFLEFFWYPLILLVCWLLNTVVYLMIMVDSRGCIASETNIPLSAGLQIVIFIGTFTARLQGFFNGFVYLRTKSVWNITKQAFSRSTSTPRLGTLSTSIVPLNENREMVQSRNVY